MMKDSKLQSLELHPKKPQKTLRQQKIATDLPSTHTVPEWNLLPADMKETTSADYFENRLDAIDLEDLSKKAHFKI